MKTKKVVILKEETIQAGNGDWGCSKITYRECKPGERPNGEVADIKEGVTYDIKGIKEILD